VPRLGRRSTEPSDPADEPGPQDPAQGQGVDRLDRGRVEVGTLVAKSPAFQLTRLDGLNDRAERLPLSQGGREGAQLVIELCETILKLVAAPIPVFARGRQETVGLPEGRSDDSGVEEVPLQHLEDREIGDVDRDLEVIGTGLPPSEVVGRTAIAMLAATPTVAAAVDVERTSARAACHESREEVLRLNGSGWTTVQVPAGATEVRLARCPQAALNALPQILRHDPETRIVSRHMLAFRAPTLVPAAPAVPLLRPVPDHVPSVQGPMEDRSYGEDTQPWTGPRRGRGASAPSPFRIVAIAVSPRPATRSSKIRRTTAASPSWICRATWSRVWVPSASGGPRTGTLV
jgi:hypothetical protein